MEVESDRRMDRKVFMKQISQRHVNVSMDEKISGGKPRIKGTRIPISLILACFRDGMSIDEICEDYQLTHTMVKDALNFAIQLLDDPYKVNHSG